MKSEDLSEEMRTGMQGFIKAGLSPADRLVMMVRFGIPADVLDGMEILVKDDYPWEKAITIVKAMKKLADEGSAKPVKQQAEHFVVLRQAMRS